MTLTIFCVRDSVFSKLTHDVLQGLRISCRYGDRYEDRDRCTVLSHVSNPSFCLIMPISLVLEPLGMKVWSG